jgi:hypothetical protein
MAPHAAPMLDPNLLKPGALEKWPPLMPPTPALPSMDPGIRFPPWLPYLPISQQAGFMLANCRAPWSEVLLNAWRQRLTPTDLLSMVTLPSTPSVTSVTSTTSGEPIATPPTQCIKQEEEKTSDIE